MTVMTTVIVHPNPGVGSDEIVKNLVRAKELVSKHGGENTTLLVNVIGGLATNDIGMLTTSDGWESFGKIMAGLTADQEYASLIADAAQISSWETHVVQTLEA
jgi:hypothetical protein